MRLEERRGGRPGRIPWTITNGTYLAWTRSRRPSRTIGGWMSVTEHVQRRRRAGADPSRTADADASSRVLQARALMGRVFEAGDAAAGRPTRSSCRTASGSVASAGPPTSSAAPSASTERALHRVGVMPAGVRLPRPRDAGVDSRLHRRRCTARAASASRCRYSAPSRGCGPASRRRRSPPKGPRAHGPRAIPAPTALALFGSAEPPTITATPALDVVDRRRSSGDSRHARRRAPALRHRDCQRRRRAARPRRAAPARDDRAGGARREHGAARAPVADGERRRSASPAACSAWPARGCSIGLLPADPARRLSTTERHHARLARRRWRRRRRRWRRSRPVRSSPPCRRAVSISRSRSPTTPGAGRRGHANTRRRGCGPRSWRARLPSPACSSSAPACSAAACSR